MNQPAPWKPPLWILFLDLFGMLFLGLGLVMHYAPDAALATALPVGLKLPFILLGGVMLLAGVVLVLRMVMDHRSNGPR